eukprot:scaffold4493_cov390-Prasinococcus_capsulatus_cf.AAC.11
MGVWDLRTARVPGPASMSDGLTLEHDRPTPNLVLLSKLLQGQGPSLAALDTLHRRLEAGKVRVAPIPSRVEESRADGSAAMPYWHGAAAGVGPFRGDAGALPQQIDRRGAAAGASVRGRAEPFKTGVAPQGLLAGKDAQRTGARAHGEEVPGRQEA